MLNWPQERYSISKMVIYSQQEYDLLHLTGDGENIFVGAECKIAGSTVAIYLVATDAIFVYTSQCQNPG